MSNRTPRTAKIASIGVIHALLAFSIVAAPVRACEKSEQAHQLAIGTDATSIAVPGDVWVQIEEQGQPLAIDATAKERIDIDLPPRFGRTILHIGYPTTVHVRRSEADRSSTEARLSVLCDAEVPSVRHAWWSDAAELARTAASPLRAGEADAFAKRAAALSDTASGPSERALALHLAAQGAMQAQQYSISANRFERAAKTWKAAGDVPRASAARVGQAESLVANGRYDAALALVSKKPSSDSNSYYEVRLRNSRCLSLHYLHRLAEASACYGSLERSLHRLDEPLERANALRNHAEVLLASANLDGAAAAASEAYASATGAHASIVRGRAQLTLADISIARGDVQAALEATVSALSDFADAGAPAWQGDAKLKAARIFAELGAGDDAYLAVRDAFRDYTGDEPALIANALTVYADIERDHGRFEESRLASISAAQIYSTLKMPMELERARLAIGRTALAENDLARAESSLAEVAVSPSNAAARSLLEAELDARLGNLATATKHLLAARRGTLGFAAAIDATRIEAEILRRRGDPRGANTLLRTSMDAIIEGARGSGNALLRRMLEQQAAPLRLAGIASTLIRINSTGSEDEVEAAWAWIAPRIDGGRSPVNAKFPDGSAFDRAIAQELLGPEPAASDAARNTARTELLALLATRGVVAEGRHVARLDLSEVKRQLLPGDTLLGFLDGGTQAAVLVVTRTTATVYPVQQLRDIRSAMSELAAIASSRATSSDEIDTAAREMSAQLFGHIPVSDPPRNLFVLADGVLDGLPWNLLTWPGQANPLIATTSTTILHYENSGHATKGNAPPAVIVFSPAPQYSSPALPDLAFAKREPSLIRLALAGWVPRVVEPNSTPEQFLVALHRENAWVHIAAHGIVRPGRIGYSGIWFGGGSSDGSGPFLGWLEVLSHGVIADTVVLDACDLGGGREISGGTLSFASAVSEAGARHVVASLWPISDAASAIWVPAFYSALAADPAHDVAAALRMGQLHLRSSRMFRHPFYWSGLETFSRGTFSSQ